MIGKLTPEELNDNVLSVIKKRRKEVKLSAAIGSDSASLQTDKIILVTTDPITSGSGNCGSLAVNVCCNDIAAEGGEPIAVLLTVLAPVASKLKEIKTVMFDAEKAAEKLNVEIIGGHTEITDAVNRIIVNATAIGIKINDNVMAQVKSGDSILVTKDLGLEGTAVIANNFNKLISLNKDELLEAKECLNYVSVVEEGKVCSIENISSMHDITEGGVYGALCEVLMYKGVGADIEAQNVPFRKVTEKICQQLHLDKYRLLSSGSMLITTADENGVTKALINAGLEVRKVGTVRDGEGVTVIENGKKIKVKALPDEINKLL
ncbi:MAG: AIR synthase-related protein [Clostridia bacterium]